MQNGGDEKEQIEFGAAFKFLIKQRKTCETVL